MHTTWRRISVKRACYAFVQNRGVSNQTSDSLGFTLGNPPAVFLGLASTERNHGNSHTNYAEAVPTYAFGLAIAHSHLTKNHPDGAARRGHAQGQGARK
jgi:hypothetical protein